jgi:hypothetical protein
MMDRVLAAAEKGRILAACQASTVGASMPWLLSVCAPAHDRRVAGAPPG